MKGIQTKDSTQSIYSKKLNGMLFKWDGVIWGSRVLGANSLWTASDELQDFDASSISITTQSLSDIVVAHAVLVFWFVSAIHRECFARAKQQQFHSAPRLSATFKAMLLKNCRSFVVESRVRREKQWLDHSETNFDGKDKQTVDMYWESREVFDFA